MSTIIDMPDSDDTVSRILVDARSGATPLAGFPGTTPSSMAHAYRIQSASIARWPDTVAGWKVGLLAPHHQEQYSVERLAGPIFRSQIRVVVSGSRVTTPIFVGGFAAIEAEFVIRLGKSVAPDNRRWSDKELVELVGGLHVGAEIASSPMAEINNLGPAVVASDFGNNAGLLLGPEILDWHRAELEELPSKVTVDGECVGEASAAAIPGGPVAALGFVVSMCAKRGLELPAGTLISTGASTGIHDVETTSVARIEFGDFGWFEVTFEPMLPTQ